MGRDSRVGMGGGVGGDRRGKIGHGVGGGVEKVAGA